MDTSERGNVTRILDEAAGLSREQAINLRARLKTFEDDWNAPGMEAYDEL